MKKRWTLVVLLALITVLLMPALGRAAENGVHKTAYIVVADKLAVYDIGPATTPHLYELIQKGDIGLASNRALRGRSTEDTSITIGAGNLGRAYQNGIMAFNREEMVPNRNQTAEQLYRNLTGIDPEGCSALVVNLPEIIAGMEKEKVNTIPGALGEVLRLNGKKVCVLGNSDTGLGTLRAAAVIGMDARGQIPLGDIGHRTYQKLPDSFLGYETNYEYLWQEVERYDHRADVVIIELSDLGRLDTVDTPLAQVGEAKKKLILGRIDNFIGKLAQEIDPSRDLILVISPSPSKAQIQNKDSFTPVIAYGSGFGNGILSSGATRRDYIIANTDIAPTVLKFFGLRDTTGTIIGQPIKSLSVGNQDSLREAKELGIGCSLVNRLRLPLIKGYVFLQILVIVLSLFTIFWVRELARILQPFLLALVVVPLVLLPLGKVSLPYDWLYILFTLLMTIILTVVLVKTLRGNNFAAFIIISMITVIALNIDLLTGAGMIQSSVLGYDPMSGARYYGIGNEYLGILIGSTVAVCSAIYQKFKSKWILMAIALIFLFECFIIGAPSLGAQSDGMVTAPFAFLVTLVLLSGIRIRPSLIFGLGAAVALAGVGLISYDMHQPLELQSHIGRATNQILAGGWREGSLIVSRKLAMNFKLMRYTIWSWVFIVVLVVLSILICRPLGAMSQLRQKHPCIIKGFAGIATGALVGLVINDSGIVAASTTAIYLVVPLLLLMLRLQNQENKNP